jgi:hypothetical protein
MASIAANSAAAKRNMEKNCAAQKLGNGGKKFEPS